MEFFNGPVERWVKSQKHPFLRGLPWRFPKFQIHWSLAVPNSTPTPPPWPEITFLVSFSPTGYSLTFGQPALAIGQTTYQADTWPMGKPLKPKSNAPGRHWKIIRIYTKEWYTRKVQQTDLGELFIDKLFNFNWKGLPLNFGQLFPLFFRSLRLRKEILLPPILSRTLLLQIFRSVFSPQPTPKKWINKKNHSNQNLKLPLPPATRGSCPKNIRGLARRVGFFHSAPPGWHRVAHRTSRKSPPIAMRQEKGPKKHEVSGVDVRFFFWVGAEGFFFGWQKVTFERKQGVSGSL